MLHTTHADTAETLHICNTALLHHLLRLCDADTTQPRGAAPEPPGSVGPRFRRLVVQQSRVPDDFGRALIFGRDLMSRDGWWMIGAWNL